MANWFDIEVFGQDLEGIESEGGWQLYLRTNVLEEAEKTLKELLAKFGWDNVCWDWNSEVAEEFAPR